MRSGPGAADAQGVYHLGEADDPDGSFSGLMDLPLNSIRDQFAADRVRLSVREQLCALTLSKSMASAAAFTVLGDGSTNGGAWTELSDAAGMHSPTVNPARVTPGVAGLYKATLSIAWPINSADRRGGGIRKNAADLISGRIAPDSATGTPLTLVWTVAMTATDYFDFTHWQNSGATLNPVAAIALVERIA